VVASYHRRPSSIPLPYNIPRKVIMKHLIATEYLWHIPWSGSLHRNEPFLGQLSHRLPQRICIRHTTHEAWVQHLPLRSSARLQDRVGGRPSSLIYAAWGYNKQGKIVMENTAPSGLQGMLVPPFTVIYSLASQRG
jgi:hypothetical protein